MSLGVLCVSAVFREKGSQRTAWLAVTRMHDNHRVSGDVSNDFSIDAFHDALDAERRARGLSWLQLTREVNGQFSYSGPRATASTLGGMRSKRVIEGDGALQAMRWLRRPPESFVPGHADAGDPRFALPDVPRDRILRFDTKAIHAALDGQRTARGLTWKQVAEEIGGINASGLTRYADGGRTAFPHVMRIARWLDRPAASLTRLARW